MRWIAMAVLALVAPRATAEEWTRRDTAYEAAFVAGVAVDCGQTLRAMREGELYERNPILGRNPSARTIYAACAGAAVGHALVAALLPAPWRRVWQVEGLVMEGVVTLGNGLMMGGFRVSF
jgi:hypothetical protein